MYYAAVLSLPFLVMEWLSRRQWQPIAQTFAIFAVAIVPIAYDKLHYRADPAWNHFYKAHALLESLLDAPMVEYSEATRYFFDRAGWSRADWEMLESWFCPDADLYSIPRLTRIVERFKGSNWSRAADGLLPKQTRAFDRPSVDDMRQSAARFAFVGGRTDQSAGFRIVRMPFAGRSVRLFVEFFEAAAARPVARAVCR